MDAHCSRGRIRRAGKGGVVPAIPTSKVGKNRHIAEEGKRTVDLW